MTRESRPEICQVRRYHFSQSQQGRMRHGMRLSSVCQHLLALQLSRMSLSQSCGTQMQRVRTLKSQHNLKLDCYNKYIRDKRRFQT